jgi:molecular chaperone DnaK
MGRAIGIDLGTTNTAVAVMRDGRPRVLEDDKGYNVFPSCISLTDEGGYLIGATAKSLIMTRPDRTVSAIKRLMGRRFDSPQALQAQRRMGYQIAEAADGMCEVVLAGQRMTPVEVSARILAEARRMAENALGEPVDQAVITVPAYFNHAQRQSTIEAAALAGLRCERLLNEPTAAALAYGFRRNYDRTIVVYDLGGGTFDVSILQLAAGVYETLATRGDTYLGGEDFDFRLVDHLADDFQNRFGVDLRQDVVALQRLKDAAERAKCELSFTDVTTVLIPRVTASRNLEMSIDRLTLEGLVDDLVERTLDVTRKSLTDAGLQISDIDDVILVGGQTRMPRVREAIAGMFQKEPSRGVHPEEVVAIGAAVHAGSLVEESEEATILLDVTPFNLGIDLAGGLFRPIIMRNTHVPISATQKFVTARENQDSVRVVIRQGESKVAVENEFLGEFAMGSLTPGSNLRSQVEVTFRIDSNGMLHVSAVEPTTGERKKITVRNYAQYASQGGGALDIEGDTGPAQTSRAPTSQEPFDPDSDPAGAGQAPSASGKKEKSSFLRGLFRRGDKPAAAPAQPAPGKEPPVEHGVSTVDDDGEVSESMPLLTPEDVSAVEPELASLSGTDLSPLSDDAEDLNDLQDIEIRDIQLVSNVPGEPPLIDPFIDDGYDEDDYPDALEPADLSEPAPARIMARPIHAEPQDLSDLGDIGDLDDLGNLDDLGGGLDLSDFNAPDDVEDDLEDEPDTQSDLGALSDLSDLSDLGDLGDFGDLSDPGPTSKGGSFDLGDLSDFSEDEESVGDIFTSTAAPASAPTPPPEPAPEPALELEEKPEAASLGEIDIGDLDDLFSGDDNLGLGGDLDLGDLDFDLGSLDIGGGMDAAPEKPSDDLSDEGIDLGDFDDMFAAAPDPTPEEKPPVVAPPPEPRKKPARLKLSYRKLDAMVKEYRSNLADGGSFVKTSKPLKVGRECQLVLQAPGLAEPLTIPGVVSWSSDNEAEPQKVGMRIDYQLSEEERSDLEDMLDALL